MAPVRSIHVFTESTKLLLPAAFLIVPNSVQLKSELYNISHSPRYSISAFKTKPTEDNMLLQLASCHVCKADVVFFIVLDNANICILNGNFCHCIVIDAMSFNHKSRYNLRDYVFFNGLFAKMKYNNSIIGIVFPDNYFNSILERIIE